MKRIFGTLSMLLILVSGAEASAWNKKVDDARKAARAGDRLIFVDLFAEWCGWCHRFEREIVPSEAFQNATKEMVLLRVDTEDGGEGTELARRYNVTRLPTFLVLTPEMTVAAIIQGYAPPQPFVEMVRQKLDEYEVLIEGLKSESKKKPEERLALATELVARHDFAGAQARLRKLAGDAGAPDAIRAEARYMIAVAQASDGKGDEALATVESLLDDGPRGDPAQKAVLLRARILVEKKDYPAALREYKRFKTSYPGSPHMQTVDYYIPQLESVIARNSGR
ncbi:MAG TPA: thioredoxin family protein [Thermoanaerobaculia bacterium]|nr:thioredoxin family protein [Thermoanaerobaculia bacterium]